MIWISVSKPTTVILKWKFKKIYYSDKSGFLHIKRLYWNPLYPERIVLIKAIQSFPQFYAIFDELFSWYIAGFENKHFNSLFEKNNLSVKKNFKSLQKHARKFLSKPE